MPGRGGKCQNSTQLCLDCVFARPGNMCTAGGCETSASNAYAGDVV